MAWKGVGDDQRIFFNVKLPFSQGRAWTNQQLVPGAGGTSAAPALAQLGGKLYMVWKRVGDDPRIFFNSTSDGQNWTHQQWAGLGIETSAAPALVLFSDTLYLVFKAGGNDPRIFFN